MSELVNFLYSVSDAAVSEPENEDAKANAFKILSELYEFLCSPSLDQVLSHYSEASLMYSLINKS